MRGCAGFVAILLASALARASALGNPFNHAGGLDAFPPRGGLLGAFGSSSSSSSVARRWDIPQGADAMGGALRRGSEAGASVLRRAREGAALVCKAAPAAPVGALQGMGAKIEKAFPGAREVGINAWAALLAGAAGYLIATPLEAFKVGLQTWPGASLTSVGRNILAKRGLPGFFYGLDAMYAAGLPYSVILYSVYQPIKRWTNQALENRDANNGKDSQGSDSMAGSVIGGSIAEVMGLLFFMPGELIRMRMMGNPGVYSSFLDAGKKIVAATGAGTLYRGFKVTCFRDIPYTVLTFVLFENVRDLLAARHESCTATFLDSVAAGVAAAIVASTATIPLDVLKSNIMASSGSASMRTMSKTLFREGGAASFGKGYLPFLTLNSIKWTASMAVYATVREFYGLKTSASH